MKLLALATLALAAPAALARSNILELAAATPDLSTLVTAINATAGGAPVGVEGNIAQLLTLRGPFTVFAPTNEAFAALPAGVLANLLKPENVVQLSRILQYHIANGDVISELISDGDQFDTFCQADYIAPIPVTATVNATGIFINNARVTTANVLASNGVVHIIDQVLIPPTIVDVAANTPDISTLVTALKAGDLVDTLSGAGPFTVFAPTNEAFAALPAGVLANLLKPENKAALVDVLTYHVHVAAATDREQYLLARNFCQGLKYKTLEGNTLAVTAVTGGDGSGCCGRVPNCTIVINTAKITTADVPGVNGVVHIIDAVLLPGPPPTPTPAPPPAPTPPPTPAPGTKTIVELAVATPDLSTLVTALKAGDLVDTLSGPGPFTVFAPTNEAFAALPAGTVANLLKPENKAALVDVLTYHVVSVGAVFSKDIINGEIFPTVEGKTLTATLRGLFKNTVFINDAKVTTADVAASNGVVHIIDKVLLPPKDTPAPTPTPVNHLWFYWVHAGFNRCGDVDAASRMPASLFDPANKAELDEYVSITEKLWLASIAEKFPNEPQKTLLTGQCKDHGYDGLSCKDDPKNLCLTADWAPKKLMAAICAEKCNCQYPDCKDVPDDPSSATWCSLCGPKFNAPIVIDAHLPSGR